MRKGLYLFLDNLISLKTDILALLVLLSTFTEAFCKHLFLHTLHFFTFEVIQLIFTDVSMKTATARSK